MRKEIHTQMPEKIVHMVSTAKVSIFTKNENMIQKVTYFIPQFLMLLFIFLSPFTQDTSIKEFCFYISATFFLVDAYLRKPWIVIYTPLTIAFFLFLLWAIAGIPTALNKPNTIHDILSHWVRYVVIYYLILSYFNKHGEFKRLAFFVVLSGFVYSIWYICYFYLYLARPWSARLVMYPYRDYLFTFASMIAVGFIQEHKGLVWRFALTVALLCILAAAILSQARNVVLAISVGSMIYMIKYRKTAICMLLAVIICIGSFSTFRERLRWEKLLKSDRISTNFISCEIIKDYPLFGIGFGMQTYGYKEFINLEAYYKRIPKAFQHDIILGSPHNLLLDVTVRTGILGGLLFLFIYWCEFRMLYIIYRKSQNAEIQRWAIALAAAFVAFLVQSQFGDAAFSLQAIVFFSILAMTSILWNGCRKDNLI